MSRLSSKQRRSRARNRSPGWTAPILGTGLCLRLRDRRLDTPEVETWLKECARAIASEMLEEMRRWTLDGWVVLLRNVGPAREHVALVARPSP